MTSGGIYKKHRKNIDINNFGDPYWHVTPAISLYALQVSGGWRSSIDTGKMMS